MIVKLKANIALALAFCAVLFCSCGTKEELFDSYDSCFVPISSNAASFALTPDTAKLMIRGEKYEYSFANSLKISFSCPVECDSYSWKITHVEDDEILSDKQNNKYSWNTPDISFYITKSDDCVFYQDVKKSEKARSYRLYLVVKMGEHYFYDDAVLIFHALD